MQKQMRVATNPGTYKQVGAFDAWVQDEQEKTMRQKYADFVEDCKHDLDPIEAEYGGIISFDEFCIEQREKEHD